MSSTQHPNKGKESSSLSPKPIRKLKKKELKSLNSLEELTDFYKKAYPKFNFEYVKIFKYNNSELVYFEIAWQEGFLFTEKDLNLFLAYFNMINDSPIGLRFRINDEKHFEALRNSTIELLKKDLDISKLDYSFESLKLIDNWYDNNYIEMKHDYMNIYIVIYIGEVINRHKGSRWNIVWSSDYNTNLPNIILPNGEIISIWQMYFSLHDDGEKNVLTFMADYHLNIKK